MDLRAIICLVGPMISSLRIGLGVGRKLTALKFRFLSHLFVHHRI